MEVAEALTVDTENVYPLAKAPIFLVLSRVLLLDCAPLLLDCKVGVQQKVNRYFSTFDVIFYRDF